jgi:hypothetical protein
MGRTRAMENRAIRQEALREQLSKQKHIEQVVDIATKLGDLDNELDPATASRLKASAEIRLKLIGKYLGDVRAVELSGSEGGDLVIAVQRKRFDGDD